MVSAEALQGVAGYDPSGQTAQAEKSGGSSNVRKEVVGMMIDVPARIIYTIFLRKQLICNKVKNAAQGSQTKGKA